MSLKKIARDWLTSHGFDIEDRSFDKHFTSLVDLLEEASSNSYFAEEQYDSTIGDDKECLCGDPYYRHFDLYDNMAPVGCKYCSSYTMSSGGVQHGNGICTGFKEKK